jgi:nicotinamide riboside transporter PnuC
VIWLKTKGWVLFCIGLVVGLLLFVVLFVCILVKDQRLGAQ